jgi:hypothetical protein
MNAAYKIRAYKNNINDYYLIKVSKLTYEQKRQYIAERRYMLRQRTYGVSIIIAGIIGTMLFPVLAPANILTGFIGLVLLSTKDHITG